jgi:hypothetical protein
MNGIRFPIVLDAEVLQVEVAIPFVVAVEPSSTSGRDGDRTADFRTMRGKCTENLRACS